VAAQGLVESALWGQVVDAALLLFRRGQQVAERAGLILADTKYEFGVDADGGLLLIDEMHTPDSSRYWIADSYAARLATGDEPESLDKEVVRRALLDAGYTGHGEPPPLPADVWRHITRYRRHERLTGLFGRLVRSVTDPVGAGADRRQQEAKPREWCMTVGRHDPFETAPGECNVSASHPHGEDRPIVFFRLFALQHGQEAAGIAWRRAACGAQGLRPVHMFTGGDPALRLPRIGHTRYRPPAQRPPQHQPFLVETCGPLAVAATW
jgi:hypothetical protein